MTTKLSHVRHAVYSTPWAILPEKLEAIVALLEDHAAGLRLSSEQIAARVGDRSRSAAPTTSGSVAVLPLYGLIMNRARMLDDVSAPNGTSTEAFGKAFDALVASPDVKAIILDVDSPGGTVSGVDELAAKIFAARGTKPLVAVVNSLMASAAYYIGSAADEIVVTPSGEVGSIGVYMMHVDVSQALADDGYKMTLIKAGKFKAEGSPYFPLDDTALAAFQSRVDDWYGMFVNAVARHRGTTASAVRNGYGQGRVLGATGAIQAGLADRVGTLDDVIQQFVKRPASPMGMRATLVAPSPVAEAVTLELTGLDGFRAGLAAAAEALAAVAPTVTATDAPLPALTATASDEGGAAAESPSTLIPAPAAKEKQMSALETAPPAGGTAAPAGAEDRATALANLAKLHGCEDMLGAWIVSGVSVDKAKDEILARKSADGGSTRPRVTGGTPNESKRPFASMGEQLLAIRDAAINPSRIDPRLFGANAAAAGQSEGAASDGGFAVQQDFLPDILTPIYDTGDILSRIRKIPIGPNSNGLKMLAIDETSRATGSRFGGVQSYWQAEADSAIVSKAKFRRMDFDLKKLMSLFYLTDEQLQDSVALESVVEQAFQTDVQFMLENAVVNGPGGGQPLGILNSPALVTQAIEGTQTIANSAQFISQNIPKMIMHMPPRLLKGSVFLYNPELMPTFINATVGGTAAAPVFMPPGGLSASPYGSLLGVPALPSEYCLAVGTPGDLILAALDQYVMIDKNGIQQATSIHVQFLTDQTAYRVTYRCDGQPLWRSSVTPFKGSAQRSPFVVLNTRS